MSSNSETKTQNQAQINTPNVEKKEEVEQSTSKSLITKIREFFTSWKFKLIAIVIAVIFISYLVFFWQHIMAVIGMKMWASHAKATSIDCMMKDTNNDEYISCTAKIEQQVVPLECGVSILNLGCRVNYGAASPAIRARQNRS